MTMPQNMSISLLLLHPPSSVALVRASLEVCSSASHADKISAQPTPHIKGCGPGDLDIRHISAAA